MLLTETMTISLTSSCSALALAASTADWKLILSVLSPSATAELTSHTCLTTHNITPRVTRAPDPQRVDTNNALYTAGCRKTAYSLITERGDINRTGEDLYRLIVPFVRLVFYTV